MDPTTNEDASRILRGMLNIGQPSQPNTTDNGQASLTHTEGSERSKPEFDVRPQDVPGADSFDSYNVQESPRISLDPVHQLVHLTGDEEKGSVVIYGSEVHITTNETETRIPMSAGSNRVKINPVVNFDWESKYYNGNLLSVCSKYLAYALKGKLGFVLRILNRKTLLKTLIKGFTGSIQDLSFAHYNSNLLACIDSAGDIFVWSICEDENKINYNLKLHMKRNSVDPTHIDGARLVWCPFVHDNIESEGASSDISEQILTVTIGNMAEVFHIPMVTSVYGDIMDISDVQQGIVRVENGHSKAINDIALAPDGSVVATASEDGVVKFWQLDFESTEPPRCLHEWQPHDGKPVSRLLFCDNHLVPDDKTPFWRFLITGANHNSELKIWCTVTWTCLQTIRFQLPASNLTFVSPPPLKFKASLDLSAKYLVLSDIDRKVLYVFLLHEDLEQGRAHLTSVAHFILTQPLLSFVITEAKMFKASVRDSMDQDGDIALQDKPDEEEDQETEDAFEASGDQEDDVKPLPTVKIKLHCIHPKAMQELTVQYHPYASVRPVTPSSVATASMSTSAEPAVQDGLSDISGVDTSSTEIDDAETRSDASFSAKPKLIAPNAFTTSIPQTAHTPSEAPSFLTSITPVSPMTNSLRSVNTEDLLGEWLTDVSESTCTFQTCKEDTHQEQPSRGLESFSSWTPPVPHSGVPLSGSPEAAKVPFPAFKASELGAKRDEKGDQFPSIAHSTPIPRRSLDKEQEGDTERTRTAENIEDFPSEHDTSVVSFEVEKDAQTEGPEDLVYRDEPSRPSTVSDTDKAASPVPEVAGSGSLPDRDGIEATLGAFQQSEPHEQQERLHLSGTPSPTHTEKKTSQRSKTKASLTVTPRKQVDIPPEASMLERASDSNNTSSLNEILDILRIELQQVKSELENRRKQNQPVSDVLREEARMLREEARKQNEQLSDVLREEARKQIEQVSDVLREEARMLQEEARKQNQQVSDVLREEVAMLEGAISSKVETALAEHAREQDLRSDRFAQEKQRSEKQKHEKLVSSVTTALSTKVEKTVKNELKNNVTSVFPKIIPPLQDQLNTTMAQKLTAADAMLKESIQKMVKDKVVVDAIGNAVSSAIQGRLKVSLSQFVSDSMLPGFEKACQFMFDQVHVEFLNVTQQYIRSFESYTENQKELQKEQKDTTAQQFQSLVQSFQTASEKLSTSMSGSLLEMMQTQLTSSMKRLQSALMAQLQDDLTRSLQETIQKEVPTAMVEHSVHESVNHSNPQVQQRRAHLRIQQLINAQDYCEAFQEALTAADLGLVVMVCQSCDPAVLFSQTPCPLSQPILLSLIQQLSVDLSTDTELKYKYLDEAMLALDTNDAITREHVATILDGLIQQIQITLEVMSKNEPPNSLQRRSLRRLLMAAQSLVK